MKQAFFFCWTYSSNIKMEPICSSETSADFYGTTWHYTQEDINLHSHFCESLKFIISWKVPSHWLLTCLHLEQAHELVYRPCANLALHRVTCISSGCVTERSAACSICGAVSVTSTDTCQISRHLAVVCIASVKVRTVADIFWSL
jgi:hypothetical protein